MTAERSNTCALCGHKGPCGYASVTVGDEVIWLCHDDSHVSCYHLWTVYGARPSGGDDDARM